MTKQELRFGVDLGVMTMKEFFTFLKSLGLEPHHQIQFSFTSRILVLVLVVGSYSFVEMQSKYSTALADSANPIGMELSTVEIDIYKDYFLLA